MICLPSLPWENSESKPPPTQRSSRKSESLRDYVQEVLETEFDPPIGSSIPKMAQGTVVVPKRALEIWSQEQESRD